MICASNQVDKKKYGASLAQKPDCFLPKSSEGQWGSTGRLLAGEALFVNSAPGCPQELPSIQKEEGIAYICIKASLSCTQEEAQSNCDRSHFPFLSFPYQGLQCLLSTDFAQINTLQSAKHLYLLNMLGIK